MGTLFDPRITQVAPAQDNITGVCVDNTYAWFSHSAGGAGGYISRVRQTDGVMVKADGTDGDYNDARVSSGMPGSLCLATDGTYVLQAAPTNQVVRVRLCSDMSYVTDIAQPIWGDGDQCLYAYGSFWFGQNTTLSRITPVTWGTTTIATGMGLPYGMCADGAGYIYLCGGTQYIKKIRVSDNTVAATIDMGATVQVWGVESDGTHLYILHWANPTTYVWKMRLSDGLFWPTDYSGTWTSVVGQGGFTVPLYWSGAAYLGYTRVLYASGFLYVANGHVGLIRRYDASIMSLAGSLDTASAGKIPTGATGGGPRAFAYDGTRIWCSNGLAVPSYVSALEVTPATPTLLFAEAGAADLIQLVFDLPIDATLTDPGGTVDGLTVTNVNQTTDTLVDLTISYPPQAPTEVLTGTARDPNCGVVPAPVPCPVNTWPPGGA